MSSKRTLCKPWIILLLVALLMSGVVTLTPPNQDTEAVASTGPAQLGSTFLAVPASAFVARDNSISYDTNGIRLITQGICCANRTYHAPVSLPHGAIAQQLSVRARDSSGGEIGQTLRVVLHRYGSFNVFGVMGEVETGVSAAPGDVIVSDNTINFATINNQDFAYGLQLVLPPPAGNPSNLMLYSVRIQYLLP